MLCFCLDLSLLAHCCSCDLFVVCNVLTLQSQYYLRTKPAVDALKFTVDPLLIKQQAAEAEMQKMMLGQQQSAQVGKNVPVVTSSISTLPLLRQHTTDPEQVLVNVSVLSPTSDLVVINDSISTEDSITSSGSQVATRSAVISGFVATDDEDDPEVHRKRILALQQEIDNLNMADLAAKGGSCAGGQCSA